MRKLLMGLALLAASTASACTGDDRPITMEQLPAAARQFVVQHFADVQVAYVSEDPEVFSTTYDVGFVNGSKVEFDKNGAWKEVDCTYAEVPAGVVPLPVVDYLRKTWPQAVVKKIERGKRGCEVTLDNGFDLKFDRQYRLLGIDD